MLSFFEKMWKNMVQPDRPEIKIFFPENVAIFKKMWKNMIEPDRPQTKI